MKAHVFVETGEVRVPKDGEWYKNCGNHPCQSTAGIPDDAWPILRREEYNLPDDWSPVTEVRKLQDAEYRLSLKERDLKAALECPSNRYTQWLNLLWACRHVVAQIDDLQPKVANNLNLQEWRESLSKAEYGPVVSEAELRKVPECPSADIATIGGWHEGYRACLRRIGLVVDGPSST